MSDRFREMLFFFELIFKSNQDDILAACLINREMFNEVFSSVVRDLIFRGIECGKTGGLVVGDILSGKFDTAGTTDW